MTKPNSKLNDLLSAMRTSAQAASVPVRPLLLVPMGGGSTVASLAPNKVELIHRLMAMVQQRFGIHPSHQVEKKLALIFDGTPVADFSLWVREMEIAPNDDAEWLSLVESLTVHETYFYRDLPLMDMLKRDILPQLIHNKLQSGQTNLKIWSAGCSSGEEAYNISMLMLECLLTAGHASVQANGVILPHPRWKIEVLGTDVSRQILNIARDAVYCDFGMGSFRSMPAEKKIYFEPCAATGERLAGAQYWKVKDFISKHVRFSQHNLLQSTPPDRDFDLILCRNVMIYFEEKSKRAVQDMFYQSLRQDNVLVLGSTDVLYSSERYKRKNGASGAWFIKH